MLSEPPLLDLTHKPPEVGVKELFDYYYKLVVEKKRLPNKFMADGKTLTSDYRTMKWIIPDGINEYDNKDFIFGMKNPRSFLDRLPFILDSMPYARVVVIVKNPFDTIGSFRRFCGGMSFSAGGHKLKEFYKEKHNLDMDSVISSENPSVLIWKYWTDLIIKFLDRIIFVRYQDAVLKPREVLYRIFGEWDPGNELSEIKPSEIRYSRECMRESDEEYIVKYCLDNAKILGVD